MKPRLILLWVVVGLFVLGVGGGLVWYGGQVRQMEFERSQSEARVATGAFVEHTARIVYQADNLLRAVRSHYLYTRAIGQTEQFIASLGLEKNLYENIYLIDASGNVIIDHDAVAKGRNVSDREYFRYHMSTPDDGIFIATTDRGRITNQNYFRVTRRITLPSGAFGGVLLINVHPSALTDYFKRLGAAADSTATLIGTRDHKMRAGHPESDPLVFDHPADAALWEALARQPTGSYRDPGYTDGVARQFIYRRVADLPLVMVHGFSEAEIDTRVAQRMRLIVVAAASACALVIMMAAILTLALHNRAQQQRYLAALQDVHDRNTALFEATHEAVILLDGDHPVDCNPQALKLFGASSREAFLALPPWSPVITPPTQPDGSESVAYAMQLVAAALRNGTHRGELQHRRIDTGEEFQVEIFLTSVQFNGKPILQAVLRDITQRVRFENRIQAANAELARRNEEQDRFLSMLSHELKTPLAVIRMSLGSGVQAIDTASRTRLNRAVADINAIVERCLQTDRLEHGRIEVAHTACNPDDLLRQVLAASADPAHLRLHTPSVLPECVTDGQLLTVILANLVDNALKYSAPDTVVDITAEPAPQGHTPGLSIVVTNEPGAAGMPDPQQVFRRYYRAPAAHGKTGSGLGLHIAEGFAGMLGGTLVYRPLGSAVQFALWIPL